jgi:hypothetical protein
MSRRPVFFLLALLLFLPRVLPAQNDGPPISITSPDAGTTFAYGEIKSHALIWRKSDNMLLALVTFTDAQMNSGQPNDDAHEFRLPGVTFDQAKGLFVATTAKGEVIPVARFKKVLFLKTIETTPNAVVRVLHPRGNITVILEAISPTDPAMHPANSDPDAEHRVDIDKILN